MKRTVRRNVFETNSSSTHSLTIVSKEEFDKFEKGELAFDRDNGKLISLEEKREKKKSEHYYEDDYENYELWKHSGGQEWFKEEYKTKGGEEIVAFGKYGYDS